jgi:hypothetical protein
MKNFTAKMRNTLNRAVCGIATGIFSDDHWEGKNEILSALSGVCEKMGWEWEINNSRYDWEDGKMARKRWTLRVTDGQRETFGVLVASGAGSMSDPLDRYDVVSYF